MTELSLKPAHELAALIRSAQVSASDVLEDCLEHITRINPTINAVVTLVADQARRAAKDLDQLTVQGERAGPLHGLPITVKDAIATKDIRTTVGAQELADHMPAHDATVVQCLRQAGAIAIGKTNLPTWSSDVQTYDDLFGTTANPWDPAHSPGGSSGGSAAAVATGMSAFDIGSDIGGSIRIPAGFCGVFGHKPTYGIVPQSGYLDRTDGTSSNSDLNVLGPLARNPEDLRLVMSVIAGAGPDNDGWHLRLPPPKHNDLGRYRLGIWLENDTFPLDGQVATTLKTAIERIASAGVKRPGFFAALIRVAALG